MIWFKHMSDMVDDPKVRRLIRKHGALGYAVYNLVIERIAKRITTDSPIPDLEETAEDMADLLNSDTVKIEEVMLNAMNLGLFDQDEITGRIVCSKIYKFIEKSQSRSKEIRNLIESWRGGKSWNVSDSLGQYQTNLIEENRTEENRTEENSDSEDGPPKKPVRKSILHPTLKVPMNQTRYESLVEQYDQNTVDRAIQAYLDWESAKGKKPCKDYAASAANWLRKEQEWNKQQNRKASHKKQSVDDYFAEQERMHAQ